MKFIERIVEAALRKTAILLKRGHIGADRTPLFYARIYASCTLYLWANSLARRRLESA